MPRQQLEPVLNVLRQRAHEAVWVARHLTNRYVASEAERLRRWLPPDGVCVDAGAHAGSWSVALSRLVPRGRVLAIEALPYYAGMLRRVLRVLGCRNVEVVNAALTSAEEPVELVWKNAKGERLTGCTHVRGEDEAATDALTVRGMTLDYLFQQTSDRVCFVKMDIEGAELLALLGATGVLTRDRPILYLELDARHCARYGYEPAAVFDFFSQRGYTALVARHGEDLRPVSRQGYEHSGQTDLWFVPAEQVDAFTGSPPSGHG